MQADSAQQLTKQILWAMGLGILIGFGFQWLLGPSGDWQVDMGWTTFSAKGFFIDGWFHLGGKLFIALLKLLVVPLVFVSLVCGTCQLTDPSKLGRLGGKAIGFYLFTTAVAISLAICLVNVPILEANIQIWAPTMR